MPLTPMDDFSFKHVNQGDQVSGYPAAFKTNMDSQVKQIRDYLNGTHKTEIESNFQHKNLLHNWYFKNPVNQRGASGTVSAIGYFIDRWELVSGSVTLGTTGLTLNGTIRQKLENAVGTGIFASVKMVSGTATASYDNSTKIFTLTSSGGVIESVKLEFGSLSTLSNDPPADYGEQLALCQRYYISIEASTSSAINANAGYGLAISTTLVRVTVPISKTMRSGTNGSVVLTSSEWQLVNEVGALSITSVAINNCTNGLMTLDVTTSGATAGKMYFIRNTTAGAKIFYSREL